MALDLSMFRGNPLRSVADYEADFQKLDINRGVLQQNALAMREKQRGMMEAQQLRNALSVLGPNATDEQRIAAMKGTGLPGGYAAADALVKTGIEQRKGNAAIAKDDEATATSRLKRAIDGQTFAIQNLANVKSPDDVVTWAQSSFQNGAWGGNAELATKAAQTAMEAAKTPETWAAFVAEQNASAITPEKARELMQRAELSDKDRAGRATVSAATNRTSIANVAATNARMAAEGAANRAHASALADRKPETIQPLVQIIGADGQPTWVERKDAIGKMPAGAGSKAEQTAVGKTGVDGDVVTLKTALDALKDGGGITSTEKGVVRNVGSWVASTPVGQTVGAMGGTYNQKNRDIIIQARPLLLRSIMQSTGMSARQLDSNAELKLWLATATDPTKGYEANIQALNNIAKKFGTGGFLDDAGSPATAKKAPPGVNAEDWKHMTPQERALWK